MPDSLEFLGSESLGSDNTLLRRGGGVNALLIRVEHS